MATVRMNITLPEDVVKMLKEYAGVRSQSSFIAESVRYFTKKKKQEALFKEMAEGYAATSEEDLELTREFEPTNLEGLEDD